MSFLANLPSHGNFANMKSDDAKSAFIPDIPNYYCFNNSDPPSDQVITTDYNNMAILKKQNESRKQIKSQKSDYKLQENTDYSDEEIQYKPKKLKTNSPITNNNSHNNSNSISNNRSTQITKATIQEVPIVNHKSEKHIKETVAKTNTEKKQNQKHINDDEYTDEIINNDFDDGSDGDYSIKPIPKKTAKRKRFDANNDDYTDDLVIPSNSTENNDDEELTSEKLREFNVAQLRDILKGYNLSTVGTKNALITRIMKHKKQK